MNNLEELKPCPFCGGKAHLLTSNGMSFLVECSVCLTDFLNGPVGIGWYRSEKDAATDWNDRPSERALIAQLEAAQKERDELKELNCHFDLSIRKTEGVNEVLRSKLEAAERALIKPLPIGELVHRLEGQTYEKWFSESDIKDLCERAEKAEAALSAANEKLSKPVVLPPRRSASSFVDEEFSNKDLAAIYNAARIEFSVKITNAGFTVEE